MSDLPYADVLPAVQVRTMTVAQAQAAIRSAHDRSASRWLAAEAGIGARTARRWLSQGWPRGRARNIVDHALTVAPVHIVAQLVATATSIKLGQVQVFYKQTGRDEGTRIIRSVTVQGRPARYLTRFLADLGNGRRDDANESFSDAMVCGYEDGLEESLGISEYHEGIEIE